jgi:hypothetical protein
MNQLNKLLKHMGEWFLPTKKKKVSLKYLQILARRARKTFK